MIGDRGCDERDVALDVECDVGALEGLRTEDAEHAPVGSADGPRETDTTTFSGAISSAKGMFLSALRWDLDG